METIIVQSDSKEKSDAIKAFMKALKISFETTKSPYNPDFVAKIKQGDEDIKAGRTSKISLDDIANHGNDIQPLNVPNDETIKAINNARAKRGFKAENVDDLFKQLKG